MRKLAAYIFLMLLLTSCEEQITWDLHSSTKNTIVVDAILTDELKTQTIILSKPVESPNGQSQAVEGATVLVSSDQLVYSFHEDSLRQGTYHSDEPFSGVNDKTYSLLVTTNSKAYSAKAILPEAKDFSFLKYEKNPEDNKYRITDVATVFDPSDPAMYEIQLDWSSAPGYEHTNADSCKATLFYYTLPTLDVSEVFAPTLEKITFPSGTVITERRYSLTNEHAAFLRGVLLETNWQGGFFNTVSANVPTNMSDGAYGYFGACGVKGKTEIVK